MRLSFRVLAIVSALTFFVLALVWLFAPGLLLTDWGVQVTSGVELVSRRAAALFAGLGVMLFSARNATPSPARSALIQGLMVAMAMLSLRSGATVASLCMALSFKRWKGGKEKGMAHCSVRPCTRWDKLAGLSPSNLQG